MSAAPTEFRIWHPAFDAYHSGFRMLRILLCRDAHLLPVELLFILDFYLLYPFLLHRASMPDDVRRAFRELRVGRDKDQFVQVPSAKSLYRDIAIFQKTAVSSLAAKGIIDRDLFLKGVAKLYISNVPARLAEELTLQNVADSAFINFLVHKFGSIDLLGARGLRALTGLVRRL